MDDLIAEFLTETNENLGELDNDLVKLEQNPNDKDLLSQIFRVIHTIKGTCGFLGLPRLEAVAHKGEDVLGLFRDGKLEVTPGYVSLIFESLDRIKFILDGIENNGAEPEGDDAELIARLAAILKGTGVDEDNEAAKALLEECEAEIDKALEDVQTTKDESPAPAVAEPPQNNEEQTPQQKESSISNQTLRVNVEVLEDLMTMVSELVLTRNQLLQILRSQNESEFSAPLQQLNHVVSDLQEGVMKTRMQPIGNAWAKLPRIIRDISHDLGKKINLDMRGQDTELDRQVLELIKDPLTHMVRNSADHGIGTPAERKASGKPETGTIFLNSYHEGGHIIIEISDDGRGLSTEKIKAKALNNNLATAEELDEMTPQQIQQFIFKPGFSTAEKVTSVSGRGVGMDVVRTNIEKIGGSIELKSTEGKGSTFTIKIPLTLAIVSALIVEAGHEKFAIPQLAVKELVMTSADGESRIETIKGTPVFRLRDHLLPLVSLEELLGLSAIDPKKTNGHAHTESSYANKYIVVTQVGAYIFGVIVDRVFDTEEIVIKPVSNILRDIEIFSGNTILGDGTVIMILDPAGIAKSSGEIDASDTMEVSDEDLLNKKMQQKTALLLFSAGNKTPKAVPLELVSRLEEIKTADIEEANGSYVVQYRGRLMPLLPLDKSMDIMAADKKPVLVFADHHNAMGLVVDHIIDITEEHIDVKISGKDDILMGSAIIDDKATDIINVANVLHAVDPHWFKDHGDEPFESNGKSNGISKRVLLVEDSPFFRNMLSPLLKVAGYNVTTAETAIAALELCEAGHSYDIIISDIEMPEMDGFEFAETVKANELWQDIPLVALSSHTTAQDMDRGIKAGFEKYVPKFDRDTLLNTLSQTLSERYGSAV